MRMFWHCILLLFLPHKVEPQCSVWEAALCGSYPQEPADICWQSDPSQSCVRSLLPDVLACHDHAPLSLCQEQTCCQCLLLVPVVNNCPCPHPNSNQPAVNSKGAPSRLSSPVLAGVKTEGIWEMEILVYQITSKKNSLAWIPASRALIFYSDFLAELGDIEKNCPGGLSPCLTVSGD